MHEMALAEAVLTTALTAARAAGRPVQILRVCVGELQQIDGGIFHDCLDAVRPPAEPLLAQMRIELQRERARFACRHCSRAYGLEDLAAPPGEAELEAIHFVPELAHAYLRCPECDSPDFEVRAGRGVTIAAIEVAPG